MTDYTPTTEDIKQAYSKQSIPYLQDPSIPIVNVWFDRWLAEVKAQAWEEGYKQGSSDNYGSSSDVKYADNPYRQGEK